MTAIYFLTAVLLLMFCNLSFLPDTFWTQIPFQNVINIYDEARRLNIKRTVHAGEVGPAKCVDQVKKLSRAGLLKGTVHVISGAGRS